MAVPGGDTERFCTLYLVRHGETEWNVKDYFQGHGDSPLTEKGRRQAEELCETLRPLHFDVLFSSDLIRTVHTAEALNVERGLAIQTSHLLRELYGGDYEGKEFDLYLEDLRKLLEGLGNISDEERARVRVGNSETNEELVARCFTILREISIAHPGKNVLVVTHGGVIRRLLIHFGWARHDQLTHRSFSNCGYVKLLCDGIDFFIDEVVGANLKK